MSSRAAVVAAVLAVALAGCAGTAGRPRSAADARFVDDVHAAATGIGSYRGDTQLVKLGHATCDDLRAHAGLQQIADILEASGARRMPAEDVGAIMSSAVKDLCPAYAGRITPLSGGG